MNHWRSNFDVTINDLIIKLKRLGLICLTICMTTFSCRNEIVKDERSSIYFNENFLSELREIDLGLNTANPMEVFEYIYSQLRDTVIVYPSENYYYFEFKDSGILYQGNIGLFRHLLENQTVNFGYYGKPGIIHESQEDMNTYITIGKEEGLDVRVLDSFTTQLVFQGKKVVFNSFKFPNIKPKIALEDVHDQILCPTMDESGLSFYLVFNQEYNYFFWILNEDVKVLDTLIEFDENFVFGKRTDFVFYQDKKFNRKILVGVNYHNVRANNWYDGPFDQMPDNYVDQGRVRLSPYLQKAYPEESQNLDEFGNYTNGIESRIALISYSHFISIHKLVNTLNDLKRVCKSDAEYIYNIAHNRSN